MPKALLGLTVLSAWLLLAASGSYNEVSPMTVAEASTPPSASQPAPAKAEAPASTGASSPPSKGAVAVGARAPDTYFYYDEPKITGWQDEDYHISPDALRHGRPAYGGGAGRRDGGRKAYDRPADEPGLNRYGSYGDDRAPPQQDSYYPGYEKEDSWREGDASYRHKEAPYHPHKPEGPSNYGNSWGSYGGPRQVQEPYVDEQPYAKHSYGKHSPSYQHYTPVPPPPPQPHYYGYDAVCVGDADYVTGDLTWNGTVGNLAAATASCPAAGSANTLQVGGYCTVACRNTTDNTATLSTITALGAATGWYSDDTRNADGITLKGAVSSYPGAIFPSTGSAQGDAAIAQQIDFVTYGDDVGQTGVMRLWATDSSKGKASVRFYEPWTGTPSPIISGAALASITASYRWYMQPANTARTPAFNMLVRARNGITYSLAWQPQSDPAVPNAWNTFSLEATTDGWRIYCSSFFGCPGSSGPTFTMTQLLADSRFGSLLSSGSVTGVGFNLGSDQRSCFVGIDWLETSLLNGNTRIDFGPGEAPPAIQYPLVMMGGAVFGGQTGQNVAPPNGWMWGVGLPGIPAQTSCFGPSITAEGVNAECANVAVAVCCRPRPSTA